MKLWLGVALANTICIILVLLSVSNESDNKRKSLVYPEIKGEHGVFHEDAWVLCKVKYSKYGITDTKPSYGRAVALDDKYFYVALGLGRGYTWDVRRPRRKCLLITKDGVYYSEKKAVRGG